MAWRRSTALLCSSAIVFIPFVSGCGRDAATGREYTPVHGANYKSGDIDILGAVIVATKANQGTLVASLLNNDLEVRPRLVAVDSSGSEEFDTTLAPADFAPRRLSAGQLINFAEDGGIPVQGTFEAGNYVSVALDFSTGESVVMNIPVVNDEGDFDGLDISEEESK
jgi:hypothetical protein